MRALNITTLEGLATSAPSPKMWNGEQSTDPQGRPLLTVPVLVGNDVAMVSVPTGQVDPKLQPLTPVVMNGVTVGNGKSGLWVSADSVTATTK